MQGDKKKLNSCVIPNLEKVTILYQLGQKLLMLFLRLLTHY